MFLLIFLGYQFENERLPPTSAAFCQNILRTNYTVMQWKSPHLAKPTLGSPSQHGWVWNDKNGVYDPVMTEFSPAPESIVALNMCKCTTGCLTQKCKFKKNGFVCFKLCHCNNAKFWRKSVSGRFCCWLLKQFFRDWQLAFATVFM